MPPEVGVLHAKRSDMSEAGKTDVSKVTRSEESRGATKSDVTRPSNPNEPEATGPDVTEATVFDMSNATELGVTSAHKSDASRTTKSGVTWSTRSDELKTTESDVSKATDSGVAKGTKCAVSNATKSDVSKATKSNDAEVNVSNWDEELVKELVVALTEEAENAAVALRNWFLRCWKRRQTRSFFSWLHQRKEYQGVGLDSMDYVVGIAQLYNPQSGEDEEPSGCHYHWAERSRAVYCAWWEDRDWRHYKDLERARDTLTRTSNSTWWEWLDGSAPSHRKWPGWYQAVIRDGLPVWFREAPKPWTRPQQPGRSQAEHEQIKGKLGKVRDRRYIAGGDVTLLTSFFAVPKGIDDVRMVYDRTRSGLNDVIWVPRCPLPTVNTMLRAVDAHSFMGDLDIGEMFLNFILHESMQALCRVDLTEFFRQDGSETGQKHVLWEKWAQAAMGLKPSPYQAVQTILVAKEVILGDRRDEKNVFWWDEVRMNLPGSEKYDPSLPWVSKIRLNDGCIAADLFIYVDDV
jgi:hypothetical protein